MAGFAKSFGCSFEYALYEISYANLTLYCSTLPVLDFEHDKDKAGEGKEKGSVVKGDDKNNKDEILAIIHGYKF